MTNRTKVLVIGTRKEGVEGQHVEPFMRHRRRLERDHGIVCRTVFTETHDGIVAAIDAHPAIDVAFIMSSWREEVAPTRQLFADLHARRDRPRLVYLDSFDATSSPFFSIVPYVDLYVKKQLLADLRQYHNDYAGGFIFTDFLARRGHDLDGWSFGSAIPEGYESRITLGWNLGEAGRFQRQVQRAALPWRGPRKTIDIVCRLALGREDRHEWYHDHRVAVLDVLRALEGDYRVAASGGYNGGAGLVSPRQFEQEMRRARIAVSPFGWGELCFRDYEAVCNNCLLIKPDVSHLVTEPNIFVPYETYVPVSWDLGDLAETCRYYLDHADERQRIVRAARDAYRMYFQQDSAVGIIARIVAQVRRAQPAAA